MFATALIVFGTLARAKDGADPSDRLLGTRYFDCGVGRSEQPHSSQHANGSGVSVNWPLFSHFDLVVLYEHTEVYPPIHVRASVGADYYQPYGSTPPSNGTPVQTILDANGNPTANITSSVLIPVDTVTLPSGESVDQGVKIYPTADSAGIAAAWYARNHGWTPFVRASLNRNFISYDQRMGPIHDKTRVQQDGYAISVGAEVPYRRVLVTAAFSYSDLIRTPDISNRDTSAYGFGVEVNLWLTGRMAGFVTAAISEAKINPTYSLAYGTGIRVRL